MIERPQDSPDVPALSFEDDPLGQRYAALEAWSGSAETITIAAVPPLPQRPSSPLPSPSVSSSSQSSGRGLGPASVRKPVRVPAPRPVPGPRSPRVRVAVFYGAVLVGLVGAVTAVWGASEEPDALAPAVAGGTVRPEGGGTTVPDLHPVPALPVSPAGSHAVAAVRSHPAAASAPVPSALVPSALVSPAPSASRAALPSLAIGGAPRIPPRATRTGAAGSARLSASFGYDRDAGTGSVRVENSGDAGADDWTVRLVVPGGERVVVTSGDVEVSQSGTRVEFHPSGPPGIAAGSSAGFSFTLDTVPARSPTGCTVNNTACS